MFHTPVKRLAQHLPGSLWQSRDLKLGLKVPGQCSAHLDVLLCGHFNWLTRKAALPNEQALDRATGDMDSHPSSATGMWGKSFPPAYALDFPSKGTKTILTALQPKDEKHDERIRFCHEPGAQSSHNH